MGLWPPGCSRHNLLHKRPFFKSLQKHCTGCEIHELQIWHKHWRTTHLLSIVEPDNLKPSMTQRLSKQTTSLQWAWFSPRCWTKKGQQQYISSSRPDRISKILCTKCSSPNSYWSILGNTASLFLGTQNILEPNQTWWKRVTIHIELVSSCGRKRVDETN